MIAIRLYWLGMSPQLMSGLDEETGRFARSCQEFVVGAGAGPASSDEKSATAEIEKIGGAVRKVAANVDWQEVDFHLSGTDLADEGLRRSGEAGQAIDLFGD